MSDYSMADISSLLSSAGINNSYTAINSTSRPNNIDLDMTDFLQLMIVQLQSQTLDDTMDTSEMMNQLVSMQMVTALTNMTETNLMTYASSLVGKEVTIGILDGDTLEERVITVIGTGMSNGSQVIFGSDGETYALNQIMAIGRLPDIEGVTKPDDTTTDPDKVGDSTETGGTGDGTTTGGATGSTGDGTTTGGTDDTKVDGAEDNDTQIGDTTDKPVENPDDTADGGDVSDSGTGDAVAPTEAVG